MKTHFALACIFSATLLWLASAFHLKACRFPRSHSPVAPISAIDETMADRNTIHLPVWPSDSVEPTIKFMFEKNMKDENIPLFKDWSTYEYHAMAWHMLTNL